MNGIIRNSPVRARPISPREGFAYRPSVYPSNGPWDDRPCESLARTDRLRVATDHGDRNRMMGVERWSA